jgi:hypothetical protein
MHVPLLTLLVTYSYNLAMFPFIHSQALIVQDGPLGLPFRGFLITHIQTHGRTPLDEWSARRRGLYLHKTTQHINITEKYIPAPSGIRIRDPSNQAAADLRLKPRGHWDRHSLSILSVISVTTVTVLISKALLTKFSSCSLQYRLRHTTVLRKRVLWYSSSLFSIVKIGLQQFTWTTDTWDIR